MGIPCNIILPSYHIPKIAVSIEEALIQLRDNFLLEKMDTFILDKMMGYIKSMNYYYETSLKLESIDDDGIVLNDRNIRFRIPFPITRTILIEKKYEYK